MLFTNHESPNTALLTSDLCQELGREASERRTALPLSKDGFMIWDDGRRTGFRSYQTLDPKPQTRSSPSTNHYSLNTSHGSQERRVKRWRGVSTDLVRPSYLLPFRESVPLKRVISFRFHLLPHQTVRADFPHTAFLYTSPQGLWDLSSWECFLSEIPYLVIIVDSSDFD